MTNNINKIRTLLLRRELSSEELVRACLKNIEDKDGEIGAFLAVCADEAISKAKKADSLIKQGGALPSLIGIPYGVKDNICVKGMQLTCASRMLENFIAPYDASVIKKLNAAGAIVLGKLNMDEFAMGSATDTSYFKPTRNPLDTQRVPGGSSGGSTSAVASSQVVFALGTDTGGSCRQPSAFCGTVSMKPTYGTVSRYGAVALASSFDQICPISADVYSNAIISDIIMGKDPLDPTSRDPLERCTSQIGAKANGIKIAFALPDYGVTDDVKSAIRLAAERLEKMGAKIEMVELPDPDLAVATYYVLASSEASSNLARFDGVRFGHRAEGAKSIDELIARSRSEGFGNDVKRRIMLGSFFLSGEGRQKYYTHALYARKYMRRQVDEILSSYDAIMLPCTPTVATRADHKPMAPLEGYKSDCFCVLANITGHPAISVPCGYGEGGMPVGVQFMGKFFSEPLLYRLAYAIEQTNEVRNEQ